MYRTADLFAGIGGIRLGFETAFGDDIKTVFVSEWNKFACRTYEANFGTIPEIQGDITKISTNDIPDIDLLVGGFPCQPFSIAGVSKKNSMGRAHGFADETQGTLFFDVARVIRDKQPMAFMLENVKNLQSHDKGNTWRVIEHVLSEELGYHIYPKILDAADWTCQHRERIYIVGFQDDVPFSWDDLSVERIHSCVGDVLLPEAEEDEKLVLSDKLWKWLRVHKEKHAARGNGFGYSLVDANTTHTRTLSARYHKDGSEILISRGDSMNPRRLSPRECALLMGFPRNFAIPVSNTQAYRQFGNSVSVPVVASVARVMKKSLDDYYRIPTK